MRAIINFSQFKSWGIFLMFKQLTVSLLPILIKLYTLKITLWQNMLITTVWVTSRDWPYVRNHCLAMTRLHAVLDRGITEIDSIFKSSLTPFPLKSVIIGQHFMLLKNLTLMSTNFLMRSSPLIPHTTWITNSIIALVLSHSYEAPVFK